MPKVGLVLSGRVKNMLAVVELVFISKNSSGLDFRVL